MNKKKSIKDKNEFLNYMLDLLEPMGELSYKPLFGGYAICKHEAAFALVFDGVVISRRIRLTARTMNHTTATHSHIESKAKLFLFLT